MKHRPWVSILLVLSATAVAQPKTRTVAAFDRYIAAAERRIAHEQSSADAFLLLNGMQAAEHDTVADRLRAGEVIVNQIDTPEIPDGLIHDWIGTVFVSGATVEQVLATVQDYDHLAPHFQPEVQASKLISHSGEDFQIFMRVRKHKVVTVVLDAESDVHYGRLDPHHWFSASRSRRIDEVGGGDHGFLWRLNSYWRFVQTPEGVIVQCEAISLTRDIPSGLGWMIGPFVTSIPRESLEFTLASTRKAVEDSRPVSQSFSHTATVNNGRNHE